MNPIELKMRHKNVKAFIDADNIELVLVRPAEPEKTLAGGWVTDSSPEPLPSQVARIVHNTRRYKNGLVNAEAGDIPNTDYLLICTNDVDIQVNDTFVWRGDNYRITGIHPWRIESKLCSMLFLGPDNRDG